MKPKKPKTLEEIVEEIIMIYFPDFKDRDNRDAFYPYLNIHLLAFKKALYSAVRQALEAVKIEYQGIECLYDVRVCDGYNKAVDKINKAKKEFLKSKYNIKK